MSHNKQYSKSNQGPDMGIFKSYFIWNFLNTHFDRVDFNRVDNQNKVQNRGEAETGSKTAANSNIQEQAGSKNIDKQ